MTTTTTTPTDQWRLGGRGGRQRLIPDPESGELLPYQRVSSFAKALDDKEGLIPWKAWMALRGAQKEPRLLQQALHAESTPRGVIDRLAEAGGGAVARDRGSMRHEILAMAIAGRPLPDMPPDALQELGALLHLIASLGTPVAWEASLVNDEWRLAGSCDLVLEAPDGATIVCDFKTGSRVDALGWGPAARKSARTALAGFYRWAVRFGHAPADPSDVIGTIRVPRGVPRPAPDDTYTAALAGSDGPQRLMVLLAAHGGLRRSEIAAARREDYADGWLRITDGKAGRSRTVPISGELAQRIQAAPPGWLFPGRFTGHIHPCTVGKALSRAMGGRASGHQLRHRYATRGYQGTRNLLAVQTLLGHSSPATTAIYVEVTGEELVQTAAAAA